MSRLLLLVGISARADAAADLPEGWAVEFDDEGDAFYVHTSGKSSWFKPNPDGSIPED